MASAGRRIAGSVVGVVLALGASATLLHFLAPGLALFLVGWILLSIPVGIAVGHCALGEEE